VIQALASTAAEFRQAADESTIGLVLAHYRLIDADDPAGAVALYSEDAVYHRPGFEPFVGREAVAEFYLRLRPRQIKSSRHVIDDIVVNGLIAASHGTFHGTAPDGAATAMRFGDFYTFNHDGLIVRRDTYYFVGV